MPWWRRTLAGSGIGGVGDDLAFVVMVVAWLIWTAHVAGMTLLRSWTVPLLLIEDPPPPAVVV